jgi:hypothetical protein
MGRPAIRSQEGGWRPVAGFPMLAARGPAPVPFLSRRMLEKNGSEN